MSSVKKNNFGKKKNSFGIEIKLKIFVLECNNELESKKAVQTERERERD